MKKLSDPVRKVNVRSVGFDVHKSVTVYCVMDAEGRVQEEGRFGSRREEFDRFLERTLGGGETHFSFEASRSSLWVYGVIRGHTDEDHIHVAQAKRVRAIANSKAKNDSNDAWWLAYLTYEGRLPEAHVPQAATLELRIATRERRAAVQRRTQIINRLKAHLAQIGEVVPGSSIATVKGQLFIAEKALETGGSRGRALRSYLDELEYQEAAINEWEELIRDIGSSLSAVKLIAEEIPGFGRTLASTVIAEADDIRRFHSAKAFGCATGLTPSDRSTSGKSMHGGITREGNPHLRWALTQGAMACLRAKTMPGQAVGDWIRAKQKRMGKAAARAAGARKLAEAIWRLFNLGECFDVDRGFKGGATS